MKPSAIDDESESVAHSSWRPLLLTHLQRYGLAVLSVGIALGLSLLLQHFHFRVPAAVLLFAVAISSWYAGPGPAVLAAILSIISIYWYFVEPVRTIYIYRSDIPYFVILTAFAVLLSWFGVIRRRIEAGLRERADLLNLTHDTVFVMDMEGVIKYWNRGAEERYGWTAEQALGRDVRDLLKTVFPEPLEEIKAKVTRTGRWEGELLHTKKDGSQLVVASRWSLERSKPGEPVAILETNNDITERKRAEEELHRLNRELRAISNCNQVLLRATDEQSLLEKICRIVCEEAGYRMAFVTYAEHDEAKSVRPVAWTGAEEGYLATVGLTWADTERGRGPTGTAIRSGETCCMQEFATDPQLAPWRESVLQRGFRSGIGLPLKDEHDNAFGCLSIYSAQPNAFTLEEIRLLEELAADLAFGIVMLRSQSARKRAEEALRESDTRFRAFVDHVGDALFVYDLEQGTIVDVNRTACESLGYTRQELIGKTPLAFHLDSHQAEMESVTKRAAAGETVFDTHLHRRKDGSTFPVEVHTSLVSYGGRRFLLKVARDVSDRLQAQEALRRSEAYLAEAQKLSHTGSWVSDGNTREVLWWSEEMCRIYGFDPKKGLPTKDQAWHRIHPEDRAKVKEASDKTFRQKTEYEVEYRIVLPDGTVKHIHSLGHPVLNPDGDIVEVVGTNVDITERKRSEAALRRSEAYLTEAQRLTHTGSWVSDGNTRALLYWSEEMFRIFGFDPTKGLPTKDQASLRIYPEDRAKVKEASDKTFREKINYDVEYRIVLPDGTVKHIHSLGYPVLNADGEIVEVIGTNVDITERKRAEQEREMLRADLAHVNRVSMLGELAASISHELKQPIAATITNANTSLRWLRHDQPDLDEIRQAAERIAKDGVRATEIIDRLRSLYKKTPPQRELLDVNEIIGEMVVLLRGEANRSAVSIRTDLAAGLPTITADRVQLQQVLMNLMLNGIEAMKDIGGVLTLKSQQEDNRVLISVSDTGVGLPAEKADRIFDAFFTTKPQGSGMGLAISRSIIESHGGRVWATPNDGRGVSFHFSLPTATQAAEAPAAGS